MTLLTILLEEKYPKMGHFHGDASICKYRIRPNYGDSALVIGRSATVSGDSTFIPSTFSGVAFGDSSIRGVKVWNQRIADEQDFEEREAVSKDWSVRTNAQKTGWMV